MKPPLTDEELTNLRDRYDEEIRFTDANISTLLDALTPEQTVIALTADHGEEFLERGWLGHTRTLYDELVSVPLIFRAPGGIAGRVVEGPVSLTALGPTLLELAGLPVTLLDATSAPLTPSIL
ncbi:MAG: arylsulfatase A-like enzyme, partial [Myxococcota bacterium]